MKLAHLKGSLRRRRRVETAGFGALRRAKERGRWGAASGECGFLWG